MNDETNLLEMNSHILFMQSRLLPLMRLPNSVSMCHLIMNYDLHGYLLDFDKKED